MEDTDAETYTGTEKKYTDIPVSFHYFLSLVQIKKEVIQKIFHLSFNTRPFHFML